MKMTADQLLKIAGITPSTTLRTRLNESAGGSRRTVKEATGSNEVAISAAVHKQLTAMLTWLDARPKGFPDDIFDDDEVGTALDTLCAKGTSSDELDSPVLIRGKLMCYSYKTNKHVTLVAKSGGSVKESVDAGAVYISDDGRVRSVSASEVVGYTEGAKAKKTPAGTVYRADDYWIIVPTAGGSGAIQIEYDGRTNAMSADEVADYTEGTKAKKTPAGTVYTADEYFVFVPPAGSVKESMGGGKMIHLFTSAEDSQFARNEYNSVDDFIARSGADIGEYVDLFDDEHNYSVGSAIDAEDVVNNVLIRVSSDPYSAEQAEKFKAAANEINRMVARNRDLVILRYGFEYDEQYLVLTRGQLAELKAAASDM